jgi:hypothetical protein
VGIDWHGWRDGGQEQRERPDRGRGAGGLRWRQR